MQCLILLRTWRATLRRRRFYFIGRLGSGAGEKKFFPQESKPRAANNPYTQDAYATLSLSNKFQIDIFELRNLPLKIELLPDHCGALLADRASQVSIGGKPEE